MTGLLALVEEEVGMLTVQQVTGRLVLELLGLVDLLRMELIMEACLRGKLGLGLDSNSLPYLSHFFLFCLYK